MKPALKDKLKAVLSTLFGLACFIDGIIALYNPNYSGDPNMPWGAIVFGVFLMYGSYSLYY